MLEGWHLNATAIADAEGRLAYQLARRGAARGPERELRESSWFTRAMVANLLNRQQHGRAGSRVSSFSSAATTAKMRGGSIRDRYRSLILDARGGSRGEPPRGSLRAAGG